MLVKFSERYETGSSSSPLTKPSGLVSALSICATLSVMLPVVGTNTDTTVEARWTMGPRNAESVESRQADQSESVVIPSRIG